jgi:iron(III) transport system ATP-binding protein
MTVFENVAYPLRVRRRPKSEIEQRVQSALTLVEMAHLAQRPAPALSGGQQQRVAIARALVFEPEVLLLDEPLSNLDAKLRLQMGDEFRSLQKRLGITSIYVTHDQEEAMALSDRVVVMHQGKILQIGAPEEIYHRPNCKTVAAFLGAPNLIDVRVRSASKEADGSYSMSVEGRGWTTEARGAEPCREGETAVLVVRPENISATAAANGASDGVWRGRVVHSLFRGSHRSIEVQTDSERFNVEVAATAELRVGDAVTLSPSSAWLVRT